jgi:hypothetical protein
LSLFHITVGLQAEHKATRLLILLIIVFQAAIALTFKVMFFNYYVVKEIGPNDPDLGGGGAGRG